MTVLAVMRAHRSSVPHQKRQYDIKAFLNIAKGNSTRHSWVAKYRPQFAKRFILIRPTLKNKHKAGCKEILIKMSQETLILPYLTAGPSGQIC